MSQVATQEVRTEREKFFADFTFTKAVTKDSGELELVGFASTWVKDRDGERVDPHAFDDTLENYLGKNPIVLWQHDHDKPLGTIVEAEVDDAGLKVVVLVPKPDAGEEQWNHTAYAKIKAGIVKTFSIGGFFERELRPPSDGSLDFDLMDVVITKVDLYEVSVVSVPANPDSIFEAAKKAFGGSDPAELLDERRRAALKQVEQLLGMKEMSDPDLVTMSEEERKERFELLIKGWDGAIGYDDFRSAEKEVDENPIKSLELVTELMDALYLPGKSATAKAGRVISKANEDKLRKASELLSDVLTQVGESEAKPESEGELAETSA